MKVIIRLFTLFLLTAMTLTPRGWAIDAEMFSKVEQIVRPYQQSNPTLDLDQALSDHNKLTQFTRNYGSYLRNQIEKGVNLTGPQLNLIHVSLSAFLKITAYTDSQLEDKLYYSNEFEQSPKNLALWLYQRIVISERFKTIYSLYFNQKMIRRIVQDQTQYNAYELQDLEILASRILSQERAEQISSLLSNLHALTSSNPEAREILETTVTYELHKQKRSLREIYSKDIFWSDIFNSATTAVSRGLSWAFGATVGPIEWGPGRLYQNQKFISEVQSELKPLDLIYETKSSKLTDYAIPGHWGHVGVWLGTESELKEMGLWDHPSLDDFREQIRNGNSIYEVRRWGINYDNLENFSNLDEILITRLPGVTNQKISELAMIYQNLGEQKDKTYDFTFNTLATDRTTCTEIIYLSYGPINWPSKVILGRRTISPSNVAELVFYRNSPMKMVRYIGSDKNGNMIEKNVVDLARTVGYAPKRSGDGTLIFDQIQRKCRRVRRRVGGAIRFRNECENIFVTKRYTPINPFSPERDF